VSLVGGYAFLFKLSLLIILYHHQFHSGNWSAVMFENIRRSKSMPEDYQFKISRPGSEPLCFNGELIHESSGKKFDDWQIHEPFHSVRIYSVDTGGFAVVIDLITEGAETVSEAEFVSDANELDDLFCIYAADHFNGFTFSSTPGTTTQNDKKSLSRYDQHVMEILKTMREAMASSNE